MKFDSSIPLPGQGLVSAALGHEVRREVQRRGVVVWLDRDGHYSGLVDDLIRRHRAGEVAEPVVAFGGGFLELMLALEPHADGLDNVPLLVHLPGFKENGSRHAGA